MSEQENAAPASAEDEPLLTMAEAIERLATTRATFNRWLKSGRVKGFKVGRQWRFRPSDLQDFMDGAGPAFDLPVSPLALLERLADYVGDTFDAEPTLDAVAARLIMLAVKSGARDLYVDVLSRGGDRVGVVRLRVDGLLTQVAEYDARLHQPIVDEMKRRGGIDVRGASGRAERARIHVRLGEGREIQLDTQFVPALLGESLSARLMDPLAASVPFDALGLDGVTLERLRSAMVARRGLIVMGGPAESGKQVTQYSLLHELDTSTLRLVTVERPAQLALAEAVQLPPGDGEEDIARTLAAAAASGPDVLYVNPMNQEEVIRGSVDAALSSLVIGSMHMDDASSGLCRMLDAGVRPIELADTVELVVAQRLLRKLCDDCASPAAPSADDLALVGRICAADGRETGSLGSGYRAAEGCDACKGTGYRGRIAMFEAITLTPGVEVALTSRERIDPDRLRRIAVAEGMQTLCMDGLQKAAAGVTSIREVRRVAEDLLRRY